MKTRALAASLIVATLLFGAPPFASVAQAQQATSPLGDRILPMAVGALAGAFATFFVLPLIVPATAAVATAGASTTASPVLAVIGAGVGSFIGYELAPASASPPR